MLLRPGQAIAAFFGAVVGANLFGLAAMALPRSLTDHCTATRSSRPARSTRRLTGWRVVRDCIAAW